MLKGLVKHLHPYIMKAYHKDMNEKPLLKLPLEMKNQMVKIHKCKFFYKFQDELWSSLSHVVEFVMEDVNQCVYKVMKSNEMGCKVRNILCDKNLDFVSCHCKKFKSEGISCRHILTYLLKNMQIVFLPSQ